MKTTRDAQKMGINYVAAGEAVMIAITEGGGEGRESGARADTNGEMVKGGGGGEKRQGYLPCIEGYEGLSSLHCSGNYQ